MKKVAILGPGLLGGSIALALRAAGGHSIAIWARREDAALEALQGGFADRASSNLIDVVRDAELIVFCTPIDAMPALARAMGPHVLPGALITDVGEREGAGGHGVGLDFQWGCPFCGEPSHGGFRADGHGCGKGGSLS